MADRKDSIFGRFLANLSNEELVEWVRQSAVLAYIERRRKRRSVWISDEIRAELMRRLAGRTPKPADNGAGGR